jgi:hypothetical protein
MIPLSCQLLSSTKSPAIRISVVQEGSVSAISNLLRNSSDVSTYQHCLLCLCNLLHEPDNHATVIQHGLVPTLIQQSTHDNPLIRDFCALAFLNLSCHEASRDHAVTSGAVVAIIRLAKEQPSARTKARCAATLCNLSGQVRASAATCV